MTTKTKAKPAPKALLLEIALKHFPNIETLETRNWDGLDFHDVAIWSIHDALMAMAPRWLSPRRGMPPSG